MEDTKSLQKYNKLAKAIQKENPFFLMESLSPQAPRAVPTTPIFNCHLVMFRPGLAQKPRLWLGLRWLRLSGEMGQAKATTHGLALAWLGPSRGF